MVGSFEEMSRGSRINKMLEWFAKMVGKTVVWKEPRGKRREFKVTPNARGCNTYVVKLENFNGESREVRK